MTVLIAVSDKTRTILRRLSDASNRPIRNITESAVVAFARDGDLASVRRARRAGRPKNKD